MEGCNFSWAKNRLNLPQQGLGWPFLRPVRRVPTADLLTNADERLTRGESSPIFSRGCHLLPPFLFGQAVVRTTPLPFEFDSGCYTLSCYFFYAVKETFRPPKIFIGPSSPHTASLPLSFDRLRRHQTKHEMTIRALPAPFPPPASDSLKNLISSPLGRCILNSES